MILVRSIRIVMVRESTSDNLLRFGVADFSPTTCALKHLVRVTLFARLHDRNIEYAFAFEKEHDS